jgi:hypothetical protein
MDPVPHTRICRLGVGELTILEEASNNTIAWASALSLKRQGG